MIQTHPSPIAYPSRHRFSALDLALVIGLHIGVAFALLAADVLPLPAPLATLMVRLIPSAALQASEITPPRPKAVANKPLPQRRPDPVPERPVLAAETPAAAVAEVAAFKEIQLPAAAPSLTQNPAPAVSEPRFDAAYLDNPAPVYPAISRRIGEQGKVVLRVFVEATGRPNQVQVRTGSGSPRLDQAAMDAVWRWKFVAARKGAEEVGAWVLIPIVFNLKG